MGKHSKPNKTALFARRGAVVAAAGVGAVVLSSASGSAPEAQAADSLDIIAQCESGNRNIPNSSGASTASGYYQITNGTWAAYGGREFASRAINATAQEQRIVAGRIAAARPGFVDWNASKACWGKKIGNGTVRSSVASPSRNQSAQQNRSTQVSKTPKKASKVTGRGADGRGTDVCTTDKLYFEACDPGNLGQVFQYPKYDGH